MPAHTIPTQAERRNWERRRRLGEKVARAGCKLEAQYRRRLKRERPFAAWRGDHKRLAEIDKILALPPYDPDTYAQLIVRCQRLGIYVLPPRVMWRAVGLRRPRGASLLARYRAHRPRRARRAVRAARRARPIRGPDDGDADPEALAAQVERLEERVQELARLHDELVFDLAWSGALR
jgi:hypothetical protein